MSDTFETALNELKEKEDRLATNPVANFGYTQSALTNNEADGHDDFVYGRSNNIPTASASVMETNQSVLDNGYQAQASSVTRKLLTHFFGRSSYNINKTVEVVRGLIAYIKDYLGTANGIAVLDSEAKIPLDLCNNTLLVYKGGWNASTNTPALSDATGARTDIYQVSKEGTVDLGHGSTDFLKGDVIYFNGTQWTKLSSSVEELTHNTSVLNTKVEELTRDTSVLRLDVINLTDSIDDLNTDVEALSNNKSESKLNGVHKGTVNFQFDASTATLNIII